MQLGHGPSIPQPFVWESVAAAGYGVWICGAMNGREHETLDGRILLDYWTLPERDTAFLPFNRFVNACVTRSIARRAGAPWAEAVPFAAFMARHGLRASTFLDAVRTEIAALITRAPWRTAFVLENLQLDLFAHEYRRFEPHFSLFFANAVAHLQHNYPHELIPGVSGASQDGGRERSSRAIPLGYKHLARLLARPLPTVGEETTVLLCSALGQQPPRRGDDATLYRVNDLAGLAPKLGLPTPTAMMLTMADSFTLTFADEASAAAANRTLIGARVGSGPLFTTVLEDAPSWWTARSSVRRTRAIVRLGDAPSSLRLGDVMHAGHRVAGVHHPAGILWIRGPFRAAGGNAGRPVPLTAIAPPHRALLRGRIALHRPTGDESRFSAGGISGCVPASRCVRADAWTSPSSSCGERLGGSQPPVRAGPYVFDIGAFIFDDDH
jgi:hypothetical protein